SRFSWPWRGQLEAEPGKTFDRAAPAGRGVAWSSVRTGPEKLQVLEPFLVSTGVVALGEIGDKTQLLALMLAARWGRPWPIIAGILVATLVNHALAGVVGAGIAQALGPTVLRWVIGLSFLAMAVWMLIPDKADDACDTRRPRLGVFGATVVAFFLAE